MIKWIEMTGHTDEEAISKALDELGLDRDSVSVEIVARAKSGFLGLGGTPAKVKVSYEAPDEEPPVVEKKAEPLMKKAPAEAQASVKEAQPAEAQPVSEAERTQQVVRFLTGLMEHMNIAATPQVTLDEEGGYLVVLMGEGLGGVIGRRGETLDAIQQITNYAINRGQSKRTRVHIDAENYRAKREESLEKLAVKVAGKVVKYRRNVMLEPMNAYERHVIHAALQDYKGVSTYSTGTEPNRRTVVAYSSGEHR